MEKPVFLHDPIGSVSALGRCLSIRHDLLDRLALTADAFYHPLLLPKPDGTTRLVHSVTPPLREVQRRILRRICDHVQYPSYIFAVRDARFDRSDIADARYHSGARYIYSLDIADFYPSIRFTLVLHMWKCLFHFPDNVAQLLARLTTYRGALAQGASTSSAIGNLVFWDREPAVVESLHASGYRYSRYVDDITISSRSSATLDCARLALEPVFGMLSRKQFAPKRSKIRYSASRGSMRIHHLNIGSGKPMITRSERYKIKAAVRQCELVATLGRGSEDYERQWLQVRGRVERLRQVGHSIGDDYLRRLLAVEPDRSHSISGPSDPADRPGEQCPQ